MRLGLLSVGMRLREEYPGKHWSRVIRNVGYFSTQDFLDGVKIVVLTCNDQQTKTDTDIIFIYFLIEGQWIILKAN